MNIKQLKKLIENLPDEAQVLQETGDHDLYEPMIDVSVVYDDQEYGLCESYKPNDPASRTALIIR